MQVANEMTRNQLKNKVQDLIEQLKSMSYLQENNHELMREVHLLKSNEDNCKKLLKENAKLKKEQQHNTRDVFTKDNKCEFLKREEQLKITIQEKDTMNKQLQLESSSLKKTIKKLEAALSKQEKEQSVEIHSLKLEVDKSQKKVGKLLEKNDSLQGTNTTLQDHKNKLQKQVNQLQLDSNKLQFENKSLDKKLIETYVRELHQKKFARILEIQCCNVKKQLEWSKKKLEAKHPFESSNDRQEPPSTMTTLADMGLQRKLDSINKELKVKCLLVEARDTQIEQLKKDMARPTPPENLELIPKYRQMIRERGDTIKALTAELEMYKSMHEECKRERDTLVVRVAALKKLYLKEKVQHSELFALTQVNSIVLPESSNVWQNQSREHQLDSKRTTLKKTNVRFPPISI